MEQNPTNEHHHLMPRPHASAPIPKRHPSMPVGSRKALPGLSGRLDYSLRDYLTIVFKNKWIILACFLLGILAAPVAHYVLEKVKPPVYVAKATLIIKSGREYSSPDLSTQNNPITFGRSDIFVSETLMIQSRDIKERILSTVGIETMYPNLRSQLPEGARPVDFALTLFDRDLSVREIRNSNFIELTYQSWSPDIAARVVNQLVEFYREKRRELLSDPKVTFFLEKKLAEYRRKLRESEEKLESFRREFGFYSFEKQMDFLLTQRTNMGVTIKSTLAEIEALKQSRTLFETQAKAAAGMMSAYAIIDDADTEDQTSTELTSRLSALQAKERELLTKYTEKNKFVVDVRSEIQSVKDEIAKEKKRAQAESRQASHSAPPSNDIFQGLNSEKSLMDANLRAAEAKLAGYQEELAKLETQIQTLGSQEKKLKELDRDRLHNEQYYQSYAKKIEEMNIKDDIARQEMDSVAVLQPATPPAKPTGMNLGLLIFMLMGSSGGLGTGLALAYAREKMSRGMSTPESVESQLAIPVLATVPFKP